MAPGFTRVGRFPPAPPFEAIQLAVEAELRCLWEDGRRVALIAAGCTASPPVRRSTAGRRKLKTPALLAVRVRRELAEGDRHNFYDEKLLSEARNAKLLQRPPSGREWTDLGRSILAACDGAAADLLALLDEHGGTIDVRTYAPRLVGPLSRQVVNAAIADLEQDGRITVTRRATAADRRCHGYDTIEFAAPRLRKAAS